MRFWTTSDKVKKCSDIVSRFHFKILSQIVNIYSSGFFTEQMEHYMLEFLHDVVVEEFILFPYVLIYIQPI